MKTTREKKTFETMSHSGGVVDEIQRNDCVSDGKEEQKEEEEMAKETAKETMKEKKKEEEEEEKQKGDGAGVFPGDVRGDQDNILLNLSQRSKTIPMSIPIRVPTSQKRERGYTDDLDVIACSSSLGSLGSIGSATSHSWEEGACELFFQCFVYQ